MCGDKSHGGGGWSGCRWGERWRAEEIIAGRKMIAELRVEDKREEKRWKGRERQGGVRTCRHRAVDPRGPRC